MSELNPVRIAVIGAGAMGRNHIRFVTEEPEAELVAIADAFEGARATAEAAGVPFYTDPAQMMDEVKPEAVIIATPNDLHLGVAREAVKRNIVPLVEKPISNDLEDAQAFAAEAETAEVASAETEVTAEPAHAEEATETESAPAAEEPAPVLPEVTVLDASATQAILDNGRGYAQFCDMAVLAFASFTNPGGGYIQGYLGQEATLCADSYLYNVLDKQRKWYGENRRRNINCELYRNRALVVPAVRFDRNHVHAYADVIVAAAPNVKRARQEYRVSDDALRDALRDRIRFVLAICDELGREKLVLGAWGCDNNGFDAEAVAELFRKELASGDFKVKQVFFAVPSTRWDEDFAKFEHVLANFPERNEESYAQVAARAAAARAAEQTQAATEDDEDEDDWRKYL